MIVDANEFLSRKISNIPLQIKVAFFTAIVVGLITHIVYITSMIVNHDSVSFITAMSDMTKLGRWGSTIFSQMNGAIPIHSISGVLGIFILAVTSCFTVAALSIKSNISAAIISCFIVLFPSVFSYFLYLVGDVYSFSILFAAVAVYFTIKHEKGFIAGIALLAFSLGIYQANIGYAAGLFLIILIIDSFKNDFPGKKLLVHTVKYLCVVIGAIALYYLIMRISLSISGIGLSTYRGINEMGQINAGNLPHLIKITYEKVLDFMVQDAYGSGTLVFQWVYRVFLAFDISIVALLAIKNELYRKPAKLILLVIYALLFPFAVHIIQVLNHSALSHTLMIFPFVLLFIVAVTLSEYLIYDSQSASGKWISISRCYNWAVILVSVVLIFNWWVFTNQAYKLMQYTYESSQKFVSNISEGIRGVPGYTVDSTIYIVMEDGVPAAPEYQGFSFVDTTGVNKGNVFTYSQEYYIKRYMGIHFNETYNVISDPAVKEEIRSNLEFSEMPCYPNYGYVKEIDGVIVVKITASE